MIIACLPRYATVKIVKGTINDPPFQTSFFVPNAEIFLHIQRELQCNNFPIDTITLSRGNSIFFESEPILFFFFGINYCQ